MLNRKLILSTMLSLGLTACSVGPHYKQPALALPQQFTAPDTAIAEVSPRADASDPEFWHSFNDPELTSLVRRALTANNDLRAALAHYDSANALLREAKFDRYPTVTMSTSVGRQKLGEFQAFGYPRNNRFFNPEIDASWELDFFGRVRHNIEEQRQLALADASSIAAMQVTVVGRKLFLRRRKAEDPKTYTLSNEGSGWFGRMCNPMWAEESDPMAQQTTGQVSHCWTTRRDEKQRRMQQVQNWMKGPIRPRAKIIVALENLIVSGDRLVLEGDNQTMDPWPRV